MNILTKRGRKLRYRRRHRNSSIERLPGPVQIHRQAQQLTLNINRPKLTPEDIQKLKAVGQNNRMSE
jgi:hypothetical protein